MVDPHYPRQNHLLDALPPDVYGRLAEHLELVKMKLGDVIYESGEDLLYAYFPTTSIISLLYVLESGASAEIAVVGNEGIIGIALFMGGAPCRTGRSCKAKVMPIDYGNNLFCKKPTATDHFCACYSAIHRR